MYRWIVGFYALMLVASPIALAQDPVTVKKAAEAAKSPRVQQQKMLGERMRQCHDKAKSSGLRKGTSNHKQFIEDCRKG